jgi:hypothetical protein
MAKRPTPGRMALTARERTLLFVGKWYALAERGIYGRDRAGPK